MQQVAAKPNILPPPEKWRQMKKGSRCKVYDGALLFLFSSRGVEHKVWALRRWRRGGGGVNENNSSGRLLSSCSFMGTVKGPDGVFNWAETHSPLCLWGRFHTCVWPVLHSRCRITMMISVQISSVCHVFLDRSLNPAPPPCLQMSQIKKL